MVLTADELERVADPVDVRDPGQGPQVQAVEGVDVADEPDDRADHSLAHEGRAAYALDLLDDEGDVLVRGVRCHHDNHGFAKM